MSIEAVYNLHKATNGPYDNLVCEECSRMVFDPDLQTEYPCPTIRALEGSE